MVAYTPNVCLPYLEGSDSPCATLGSVCEPVSVWCSMAGVIDAKLTEFDDIVSGSLSSFPYAQAAISAVPFLLDSGTSNAFNLVISWDTVVGDSDAIVDLSTDPTTFVLRRSGIWNFRTSIVWRSSLADTRLRTDYVFNGAATQVPTADSPRAWVEAVPDPGTIVGGARGLSSINDVFARVDTSGGPTTLNASYALFASAAFIATVEQAFISVRWVADF